MPIQRYDFNIYQPRPGLGIARQRLELAREELGQRQQRNRLLDAQRAEDMQWRRDERARQAARQERQDARQLRADQREGVEAFAQGVQRIGQMSDPAAQAAAYASMVGRLGEMYGPEAVEDVPEAWDPGLVSQVSPFLSAPSGGALDQKIRTLEANLERRLTPAELQRAGGIAPPAGPAPRARYVFQDGRWYDTQPDAGGPPMPVGEPPPDEPPKPADVRGLETRYTTNVNRPRLSAEAFDSMMTLYEAPEQSGSTDVGLIYQLTNIQDPGSMVRGEDIRTAQEAGRLAPAAARFYNILLEGGGEFNETQRRELVEAGRLIAQQRIATGLRLEENYRRQAQDWGMNPDDVTPFRFGRYIEMVRDPVRTQTEIARERAARTASTTAREANPDDDPETAAARARLEALRAQQPY